MGIIFLYLLYHFQLSNTKYIKLNYYNYQNIYLFFDFYNFFGWYIIFKISTFINELFSKYFNKLVANMFGFNSKLNNLFPLPKTAFIYLSWAFGSLICISLFITIRLEFKLKICSNIFIEKNKNYSHSGDWTHDLEIISPTL